MTVEDVEAQPLLAENGKPADPAVAEASAVDGPAPDALVPATTETTPLLHPSQTAGWVPKSDDDPPPGVRVNPEDLPGYIPPEEQRKRLIWWLVFWLVVGGLTTACVVLAIVKGGAKFDFMGSLKKAIGGGVSGAAAMVIQVLALMPLRTIMNFQYRFGGGMISSTKELWREGGFPRYYAGLTAALFQGPIARFADTFANVGILALLSSNPVLAKLPSPAKTAFASLAGALFRMILVPIDTVKTTMQTQGASGMGILRDRIKAYGIGTLWYGAIATAVASFVGSFPWFATYNWLSEVLPPATEIVPRLLRQAFIGFVASVVSDTISNSFRVLKTYRQVNQSKISYYQAAVRIVKGDGWWSLFARGLGTRILANGLQGIMFSVLWKLFQDLWEGKIGK
ncbi:mitochondrial carrier [Calocera cornea HHB12733]|uniref:Mitochondrial carrier n=1 Tax=Calocera cornea HHB12733 TaxID=1353952 RepID=A0A165K1Y6_9BASI|nr:mitochondrial carrier [Calocera cornea HHB12733]